MGSAKAMESALSETDPEVCESKSKTPAPGISHSQVPTVTDGTKEQSVSQPQPDGVNYGQLLEALQLPKLEIVRFDGDPMRFWTFVNSFECNVGKTNISAHAKLSRLHQYCDKKPRKLIESCMCMPADQGYSRAKQLLKQRYGKSVAIVEAWVDRITADVPIKDGDQLVEFLDEIRCCRETLCTMGKLHEIDNNRSFPKIIKRLPFDVQRRWRTQAARTLKNKEQYPSLDELIDFIDLVATELTDPIYGKIGKFPGPTSNAGSSQSGSFQRYRGPQRASVGATVVEQGGRTPPSKSSAFSPKQPDKPCVACRTQHAGTLFTCERFKSMTVNERSKVVNDNKLCRNCLLPGHFANRCTLQRICSVPGCGQRHTKFLHFGSNSSVSSV